MRRALRCLSAAAVIGLVPIAAWAHHGVAGYDFANPVIVEGKLVEAHWRNPHVYFTIETGVSRRLVVEASSLSAMNAFGISRKIMPAGSNVKFLVARRAKKPEANDVFGMAVVLADGSMRQLAYVRLPPSEKAGSATTLVPATGLAGHWAPASPAPMGEYAQAEGRAHGQPGQAPRADTCKGLERTPIPFATAALGVLRTLQVGSRTVSMRIDVDGTLIQRTIDLQAAHPAKIVPTPQGHSIGRWDGGTLVIDTVGFEPMTAFHQGARKHLVERLTLTEDRRQLRYEITVEDPDYYAAPFNYSMLWNHRPDLKPSSSRCDEATARRYLSFQ